MRHRKKINQNDIAKVLGISNVSVSNALAGRKGVSRELILRVRQTAAEMGYYAGVDANGRASDTILLVTKEEPDTDKAECYAQRLQEQGFCTICCTWKKAAEGMRQEAQDARNVLGIFVIERLPAQALRLLQEKCGKPVIGVGFFESGAAIDYVIDDGFHGAQKVVQYLRGKGYEEILYVKPDEADAFSEEERRMWDDRLLGYRSELYLETLNRGRSKETAEAFDVEEGETILAQEHAAEWAVKQRKADTKHRTAFFCGNVKTAETLIDRLEDNGLCVPEDIAVIGYDTGEGKRTASRNTRLTVYQSGEKKLLEQCILILRSRAAQKEQAEGVRMVLGEVTEGGTV